MGKKVLIVDDEEDIRNTVKDILEKEGYKIKTAINGDDALDKIKEFKPDLVLLDIMMPGTPVKEIVKKIKEKVAFISVVKVTEAEKEDLITDNVVGFIQKPFDIKDLIKKVKEFIK